MSFDAERPALIGHEAARRAITSALARGRQPHAWLLTGEEGIGKRRLADWIAQQRWCTGGDPPCGSCPGCRKVATGNHPDLELVARGSDPDGGGSKHEITVDQIRNGVLAALAHRPVEGRGRLVIIDGAEDMNPEAQNALLKTLEEPPPRALLVLVTSREDALLDTVRSRCQELRLQALDDAEMARLGDLAEGRWTRLARGRPGRQTALQALDVDALLAAFDSVLAGKAPGATLVTTAQRVVAEAAEATDQDGDRVQRLALSVLHARLRDLAGLKSGALRAQDLLTPAPEQLEALPDADQLLAAERALLETAEDLRRHIPPGPSWMALADELATAFRAQA